MADKLKVGDLAPDFTAKTSDGSALTLSSYRGRAHVVLYFYPKDFTPGCTAEACSFRDVYDDLAGSDTEVIGVSLDDEQSHARFASRHGLKFPLVSDPGGVIARSYGAMGMIGGLLGTAKRMTFIIDKEGRIRAVIHHEIRVGKHIEEARQALAALR